MKILITGANGFLGRNLVEGLKNKGNDELFLFDKDAAKKELEEYCKTCDFVFHLAGVNRPEKETEYQEGNVDLTALLLYYLEKNGNFCPVMLSSSIQAEQKNPYGESKKAGEEVLFAYQKRTGAAVWVYRFPNVFGKWCRPHYNSVVATFCYNIAHESAIEVNDAKARLELVYIDDVVAELLQALEGSPHQEEGFCKVPLSYQVTVGELADYLHSFYRSREQHTVPDMTEQSFCKKLYSTYLSYLPEEQFSRPLKMNEDYRGSFTELLRTKDRGQFSVNVAKPGITKGNHWHNTKNEKFVVVSGTGVIRFRKIGSEQVIEYFVCGEKLEIVDIPVGYAHSITNQGTTDMITFMWCNECYDEENPDTYFQEVRTE